MYSVYRDDEYLNSFYDIDEAKAFVAGYLAASGYGFADYSTVGANMWITEGFSLTMEYSNSATHRSFG
jgi:hypothetical protein